MSKSKPHLIAIDHDDYHASHVGHTADGGQFFLTTPFVPAIGGSAGREFVAVYLFDAQGRFLEARIDDLGTRAELDLERAQRTGLMERVPKVEAIRTDEYPTKAMRPAWSVLDAAKLRETFAIELPDWQTALDGVIREVRGT